MCVVRFTFVGGGMSGIGLILLILFIVALLGGIYFGAWCLCSVQRSRKEGHYILDSEEHDADPEAYGKKLYAGLGEATVDDIINNT